MIAKYITAYGSFVGSDSGYNDPEELVIDLVGGGIAVINFNDLVAIVPA